MRQGEHAPTDEELREWMDEILAGLRQDRERFVERAMKMPNSPIPDEWKQDEENH